MKCKLCLVNEADKKNTHYLTDFIIRSCLNEDGSNTREKGQMFGIPDESPYLEHKFQRATSKESIMEALGREPNDKEIEKAIKTTPFSVDYHFCKSCEEIFTKIESDFSENIIHRFRNADLSSNLELEIEDNILLRKFFLLQVWRSSVCHPKFNTLSIPFKEKLRNSILRSNYNNSDFKEIPLNITYLNTIGGAFEYTKNMVGICRFYNNNFILFNDFVIQFFEDVKSVNYIDLYGINDKVNFNYFTNINEVIFMVKIIDDELRQKFSVDFLKNEKLIKLISQNLTIFKFIYKKMFGKEPATEIINEYENGLVNGLDCNEYNRYTMERINEYITKFIQELER